MPALTAGARVERFRPGRSPRDDGLVGTAFSGGLRTFPLLDGARARAGGTTTDCRLRLPANLSLSAAGGAPPAMAAGSRRARAGATGTAVSTPGPMPEAL